VSRKQRLRPWRGSPLWFVISLFCALPVSLNAQRQETFEGFMNGIRANTVKGQVVYQRGSGRFDLEAGVKLEQGDFIRSAQNSYAELLLQPGNYLRVGGDTDFQILCEQHDKMRLKLNQGVLSLEILSSEWDAPNFFYTEEQGYELIRVFTPNGTVFITQPGIFRISASAGGQTDVVVRDGEALINGRRVKEKRRAIASKDDVMITEFDPKVEDAFDSWSRERAEQLVQANRALKQDSPWARHKAEGQETSVEFPDEVESGNKALVISARPGAVNFVEAGVEFSHTNKWQPLTETSQLEAGDKLRTNQLSFAELTILPDIYLRLDGGSELLLEQLSNDAIRLQLLRGAVILDVVRFDSKELPQITISGPTTSATIASEGNYRVDSGSSSDAITVRDGKVVSNQRAVGSCKRIAAGSVTACDKKRIDNFDFWSRHRGEGELFFGRKTVASVVHLGGVRRQRFKNTGFWYQQAGQTYYTFVPFSSTHFRSPYGGNYTTVLAPRPPSVFRNDGRPTRVPGPQMSRPQP
jgi:hypothetical protein